MNSTLVERLRMTASMNGKRLETRKNSRSQHLAIDDPVEQIWNDEKFKMVGKTISETQAIQDEGSEAASPKLLSLALELQHFLIGSIHFFDRNIARLATVPMENFISAVRELEGPIFREQKANLESTTKEQEAFVDIMTGFYIGLDTLMSARDMALRISNDESLLIKICSLVSDHVFDPILGHKLHGHIKALLEDFWQSEEFFKQFLAFGLTSLERITNKQANLQRKASHISSSQKVFFEYLTKAVTKICTEENFDLFFFHHLFDLPEGNMHISLVLEDANKLKIFKLLCNFILKSSDFDTVFCWLEFITTRLNSYVGSLIQSDASKKAQTKTKNIRVFYINFYSSLMTKKARFPFADGLSLDSFKMIDSSVNLRLEKAEVPVASHLLLALEERAASKKQKKSSSEQLFQAYIDGKKKQKPTSDSCLKEWVKIRGSSQIDYGYLQLVLVRQVNLAIETALKIFVIYSSREENEHIRASMFEIFDDCFKVVSSMFFNQTSSQTYLQLLTNRSNDSFAEIRSTALRVCQKIVMDDANRLVVNRRKTCIGIALSRLRDTDEKVLLQAVKAINTTINKFNEISPRSFEDKALAELIGLIGGSVSQDQALKKEVDLLAFNLFFSDPQPVDDQPPLKHTDSKRTNIVTRKSMALDENVAHRSVKTTERIKTLLLRTLSDQETHKELTKLLDRAARSYMREAPQSDQTETIDKFVQLTLLENFKAEVCYCLHALLMHCDASPKIMLEVKDLGTPSLIKETLETESDEDFIIRAKLIGIVLSKFQISAAEYHFKSVESLTNFLDKFLDQFWNQPTERLKYLCKLIVAVSDLLDNQDILSTLLSKSISFITTVRQGITEESKKQNIRKSAKIRSADEATISPLKIAFFSIFHILQNVGFKLDSKVVDHLAELAVDFMKIKDPMLFQHCLAVAYILMRRHNANSKAKGGPNSSQSTHIYELMETHLAGSAYTIKGTLFVSSLILDAFKDTQGQPTYSRRSSKSSKMMTKKVSKEVNLDDGFVKLWRAHASILFELVEKQNLNEPDDLITVINIINELSLQKEIQLRSAFQSMFSLVLCPNYEIRTLARLTLKAISDFECRVFREPIQYSIVKDLSNFYATGPFDRVQLLDLIWDFEATNILQYADAYLSTYLQEQIVQKKSICTLSSELIFPKDVLDVNQVLQGERRLELCLYLTLFYSPKHNMLRLAQVLRVYLRYIDEVTYMKSTYEGKAGVEFARKVFIASKLWALIVACLESILLELSNPSQGKNEIPTSVFGQPISHVLDLIISILGKQKKGRDVFLRFQSALGAITVFDVADSNLNTCLKEELAQPSVEEERERLASYVTGALSECLQSQETDWKHTRGQKKMGHDDKGKAGKQKKKGKKQRKRHDSESDEDWTESSDDDDHYVTARMPGRKKGFGNNDHTIAPSNTNQSKEGNTLFKGAPSGNFNPNQLVRTRAAKAAQEQGLKAHPKRASSRAMSTGTDT
jgi:hypothetical protein